MKSPFKLGRLENSQPKLDFAKDIESIVAKSVTMSVRLDDEREWLMQRAPNAIEWITSSRYCDQPSLFEHWGAYQLVKDFFELRCPKCNTGPNAVPASAWGLSRETLESEVLLVWNHGNLDDTCPKCGTTKAEFVEQGLMRGYRILHAIIGQRGGKSSTLGLIGTYIEHVTNWVAHTHENGLYGYLGIPQGDLLHMTFCASTDTQSKETVWAKFRGYRSRAPWFKRYVPWVKGLERAQETPPGMQKWEYSESDKSIKNECIGLHIDSLNSNSNGLAGRTRVAAIIDEISRMEQTESSRSAMEVYRTMDASTQTVQTRVDQFGLIPYLGMTASISSPMAVDDYGMRLLEAAQQVPRMYAVRKATWDFNPWEPYEAYKDKLKKDFVGTMRNFGASPPGATNPLIDRPQDFTESAVDLSLVPTARFEHYEFEDAMGRSYVGARLSHASLVRDGFARFIAADAGKNFDAFTVACAHGEPDEHGNIITVYDWVIRLLTGRPGQEVYFESVYQVITEVLKYMDVRLVEFDHWNSTQIIQRLRNDHGLWAEEKGTISEHFVRFLRDGYSGRIRMLPPAPNDDSMEPPYKSAPGAAIYELLHLERDPKNDRVFNSKKGLRKGWNSDDTARVMVHVHRLVQDQGYTERQDDKSLRARRKRGDVAIAEWSAGQRGQLWRPPPSFGGPSRKW